MIKISIIIPTYNRCNSLKICLKHIFNSNYPKDKFEIIVVDDGSTDNTKMVINQLIKEYKTKKKFNLKYFYQMNSGPATARNLGLKYAKGEIIAFTDDDCIVDYDWLCAIEMGFTNNSNIDCVKGKINAYNPNKLSKVIVKSIHGRKKSGSTNNIAYKKQILDKLKGFDTRFAFNFEDVDLKWRFRLKGYKYIFLSDMIVWHKYVRNLKGFKEQSFKSGIGLRIFFYKHILFHPIISIGILFHCFYYFPISWLYLLLNNLKKNRQITKSYIKSIRSIYVVKGFFSKSKSNLRIKIF